MSSLKNLRLRTRASTAGFSLVEVLIAVAILGIGLLSVAALQIQGVRQNLDSYVRSQAVLLANDYVERLYANKAGTDLGGYGNFDTQAVNCAAAPTAICATQNDTATPAVCTPAQLTTYDRYVVACGFATADGRYGGVRDLLPSGRMVVTCLDAAGAAVAGVCPVGFRHRIAMTWTEQVKGANNRSVTQTAQDLVVTVQP